MSVNIFSESKIQQLAVLSVFAFVYQFETLSAPGHINVSVRTPDSNSECFIPEMGVMRDTIEVALFG